METLFREFDEDDVTAFGKYEPDARISDDILLFQIKDINYIARVIISRFKVIIDAIAEDEVKIWEDVNCKLFTNITLEHEAITQQFAINLAHNLFEENAQITGDDLLAWGFKIL
jgi:hypothetical protein